MGRVSLGDRGKDLEDVTVVRSTSHFPVFQQATVPGYVLLPAAHGVPLQPHHKQPWSADPARKGAADDAARCQCRQDSHGHHQRESCPSLFRCLDSSTGVFSLDFGCGRLGKSVSLCDSCVF